MPLFYVILTVKSIFLYYSGNVSSDVLNVGGKALKSDGKAYGPRGGAKK